jgi:hypothetical protein
MQITASKVNKRRAISYAFRAVVLACVVMLTLRTSNCTTAAHQRTPPFDVLITWLDDQSNAWGETAWLQRVGEPAIRRSWHLAGHGWVLTTASVRVYSRSQ